MFSGNKPDCEKCGWVPIIPENFEVMELLTRYTNVMIDGMGGVNVRSIDTILKWEGVEPSDIIIQKILMYLFVSLKTRSEETKHGKKN